jgi:hypothetical protein
MGGNTRLIASHLPARTEMQYAAVQILTLGKGGEKSQSSAGRRGDRLRLFPDEGDPGAPDSGGLQTRDPLRRTWNPRRIGSGCFELEEFQSAGRDRSGFGWARTTALLCVGGERCQKGYSPRGEVGAWGLTGRESRLVRQCRSSAKRLEYGGGRRESRRCCDVDAVPPRLGEKRGGTDDHHQERVDGRTRVQGSSAAAPCRAEQA